MIYKSLSLSSNLFEDSFHLIFIITTQFLPGLQDDWLEIIVNIIRSRWQWGYSLSGWLWLLYFVLFLLLLLYLFISWLLITSFNFSPNSLFFLLLLLPQFLSFFLLSLHNLLQNAFLKFCFLFTLFVLNFSNYVQDFLVLFVL